MRTWRATLVAAAAAFLAGCGSGDLAATAQPIDGSAVDPGNADGNRIVKVLTRNLYIGADVTPLIKGGSADPGELWAKIQATNYPKRAGALADEILAGRPDVIGVQEGYRFDVMMFQDGQPAGSFAIDYVDILLAQLAARGSVYRKVIESKLLQVPVPLGTDLVVGVTDRDVILVRDDLETANAVRHVFTNLVPLSLPGLPDVTSVPRGWEEADVKVRGSWFHFVNAHLEIGDTPELAMLQYAQAWELVNNLPADGPVILVGDFNGDANASSPTYQLFSSTLGEVIPPSAPPTCCQTELLANTTSVLDQRVDLVFFRGPVTAEGASLVGSSPVFLEDGPPYWASDHAGVLASLRVWNPEFFALR